MKKQTAHWVDLAKYDLRVARHNFNSRSYVYVIFLCHLTIEKLLKACITEFADNFPPKLHDLNKLADNAGVQFPPEMIGFIDELTKESIATRYPEDLKAYTRQKAKEYLAETERTAKWLERRLKSRK